MKKRNPLLVALPLVLLTHWIAFVIGGGIFMEEWKDVIGFEGAYQISNQGRLKSLSRWHPNKDNGYFTREIIIKPKTSKKGYHFYELRAFGNRKNFRCSRLVAIHFIPNPLNKEQVNHKDGNRKNDFVDNLEWNTQSENIQHSYDKLNRKAAYLGKFGKDHNQSKPLKIGRKRFENITRASEYYNCTIQAVSQALRHKRKFKGLNIKFL